MEYKDEIQNVSFELIEYLKNGKIKRMRAIEIFINKEWLAIDQSSDNLDTPFLQMIIEKWVKEIKKEHFSTKDIKYIELIRKIINEHFNRQIEKNIQEKMKMEFETKYLNKMYFEVHWKERKYKLKLDCIKNKIWYTDKNKSNGLFLCESRSKLVKGELDIHISIMSMRNYLTYYFREIYEQTTEYKLKNIYK